jgi:CHAT domain-containing protein
VLLYNTNYTILQYQLFLERCDERAIQALLEKQDKIIENSIFSPREMVIACAAGKSALSGDVYAPISDAFAAAVDRCSRQSKNGLPPHTDDCMFMLQAIDRLSHIISLQPENLDYYQGVIGFALAHLTRQALEPNASSTLLCTCAIAASHLAMLSASKADAGDAESSRDEESTPFTHRSACMLLDEAEDALRRDKVHDINIFHDLHLRQKHHLEKIMEESEAAGDMLEYCNAARQLSVMFRKSPPPFGSVGKAIELIDLAIQRAEGLPALFRAELQNSRGIAMRVAERYQDALVSYRMARDLTNFHENTQQYLTYILNIGTCIVQSDLLDHPDYKKEAQLAFDRVLETCAGNPDHKSLYCKASLMQAKVLYFAGSKYQNRALALLDWAIGYLESISESDLQAERAIVLTHALQWLNRDASPESRRKMIELIRQHASFASKEYCDAAIEMLQRLIEGRANAPEIAGMVDHDIFRWHVWSQFVMGWRERLLMHALGSGVEFVSQHTDVLLNPSALDEIQAFLSSVSSDDGGRTDETISYLRKLIDEAQSRAVTSAEEDGPNEGISDDAKEEKDTRFGAEPMRSLQVLGQLFGLLKDTFNERTWSGTIRMLAERDMINTNGANLLSKLAFLFKHLDSHKQHEAMVRAHARMVELILMSGEEVVPHYVADDYRKFAIEAAALRMMEHATWEDAYTTLELHPHLMEEDCLAHLREEAERLGDDGDSWWEIISFIECCRDNDYTTALELFKSTHDEHRTGFVPQLVDAEDQQELLRVACGLSGEDRRRGDRQLETVVREGLQTNHLSKTIVVGLILRTLREADWTQDEMTEPLASGDAGWTKAEIVSFINEITISVRGSAHVQSLSNDVFQRFLAIAKFILQTFPDEAVASTKFVAVAQLLFDRAAMDQGGRAVPGFFLPAPDKVPADVIHILKDFDAGRASADQTSAKIDLLLNRSNIVEEPSLVALLSWVRAKCLFNDGRAPGWKRYSAAATAGALVASDLSDIANNEQISEIKADYLTMLANLPGLDREIVGQVICDLALEILRDNWKIDGLLLTKVAVFGLDGLNILMRYYAESGLVSVKDPLERLNDIIKLANERIPEGFIGTAWVRAKVLWVLAGIGGHEDEMIRSSEEEMGKLLEAYEASAAHIGMEGANILARAIFQLNLARYRLTLTPELYMSETMGAVVEDVLRRLQALREDTRWSDPLLAAEVDRLLARARIRGVRNPNHEDFVENARLLLDAWENLGPDFDPELACHELGILANRLRAAEELELADQVFARLFTVLPFLVQYAMGPERRQFALRIISDSSRNWATVRLQLKGPAQALSILESGRALFLRERFAVERNARDQEDLDAYRSAIITFDESVEALRHADPAQYLAPEISKLADAKERAHAARWRLSAAIAVTPDTLAFESADPTKPLVVLFASDSATIAIVGVKYMSADNAGSMHWEYETLGENVSEAEISYLVRGNTGWLRRDVETPNPDTVLSQLSHILLEPVLTLLGRVGVYPGTVVRYMSYGVFSAIPIAALSAGGKTFGDLYPVETLSTLHADPASTMGMRAFASESVTVFDNPSDDFAFGALDLELLQTHELVKDSFASTEVTRANFVNALTSGARIHYSGHSIFDADDVSQSHFVLSGQERLTARELMLMIQRGQVREVFLSSCAAGVVGNGVSEEHEGLASAMLVAGANTVISALWPIDQVPTALLSLYYYLARREKDLSPAEALAWAQKKLRRTTAKQARDLLARLPTQISLELSQFKGVRPLKIEPKPATSLRGVKPFVDSRHWAGFYCLSQT